MAVMVTGGTGFVGSRLVRKLIEQGQEVVVYDISPDFKFIIDIMDKITFIQGDVSILSEVINTIKTYNIKHIYHTASLLIGASNLVPMRAVRVNAVGTVNILEASRLMDVKKVIFTSSVAVFSSGLSEIDDDSPKYPSSTYGSTKLFGELYGLWYRCTYGLDFRGVRFFFVYGPGDPYAYHNRSRVIANPALGKPAEFTFSSDTLGDWLYVEDAANSLIKLFNIENPKKRIYNIGGGNYTFKQVADIVKRFIPDAIIKFTERSPTGTRQEGIKWSDKYACQEIGWKPSYTLEDGIRETINETRRHNLYGAGVYVKDKYI